MTLVLYWEATGSVSSDYTVFVHLLSPTGELIAQHDGPPLRPTSSWVNGTREIDMHTLVLPMGLLSTDYQIRGGWYHWPDLERMPIITFDNLDAADDALLLGHITLDDIQASGGMHCLRTH
jgi:hypothetical protein